MGLSCYTEVNKKPSVTGQTTYIPGIKKQKFDPYNVVIDVTSIKNLNNPGWNIIYHGKKMNKKVIFI